MSKGKRWSGDLQVSGRIKGSEAESCEQGNEASGSIKRREFGDKLSDHASEEGLRPMESLG
jgi:hypothetical protein